jgi:alkylhydroperoxidase family enzyme
VLDFENGPYDEREKAALRFGLKMTREANSMTDADVAALRAYWSEGEAVEIAAVVGTFNYFNRFNDAFGVEPTRPGEGLDS